MNELIYAGTPEATRNIVLRNTYWLLAVSLIPTIIGSWLGIAFNFASTIGASPGMWLMIFIVASFGFIYAIHATQNSGWGIVVLLAFTFWIGVTMSPLLGRVLGFSNGVALITLAAGGTAGIFAVMATLATVIKRDISGWGKFLVIGMVCVLVGMVANIWLHLTILALVLSVLAVIIFSAYLLFDLKRIIDGGETNYITATLGVYLSLINIFQNLLAILGMTAGRRD
jgi:modulator of FtsH protease